MRYYTVFRLIFLNLGMFFFFGGLAITVLSISDDFSIITLMNFGAQIMILGALFFIAAMIAHSNECSYKTENDDHEQ